MANNLVHIVENEFSKLYAKQKSKFLFTGLKKFSSNSNSAISKNYNYTQTQPLRGSSFQRRPKGRGKQLIRITFQQGGENKFSSSIKSSDNAFKSGELPKRSSFSSEIHFRKYRWKDH